MDDVVRDHSTFTKNRDRLLAGEVVRRFFFLVLSQADRVGLLSKEHFSVDGTLIEALASLKSYRPKDEDGPPGGGGGNPDVDFHGEKRSRDTHESKTENDALLFKKNKGTAAKLSYQGHLLMENRHGLVVEALSGTNRVTLGADKNDDTRDCVDDLRCANATPHVTQNTGNRASAIDGRTTRHPGYAASQRFRRRIEEYFGWAETIGGLRESRFVGREKLDFQFRLAMAAYNLVRMPKLGVASFRRAGCLGSGPSAMPIIQCFGHSARSLPLDACLDLRLATQLDQRWASSVVPVGHLAVEAVVALVLDNFTGRPNRLNLTFARTGLTGSPTLLAPTQPIEHAKA